MKEKMSLKDTIETAYRILGAFYAAQSDFVRDGVPPVDVKVNAIHMEYFHHFIVEIMEEDEEDWESIFLQMLVLV